MTDLKRYQDELSKCSKCGFCHAFCPVYAVTGLEMEAARGRNAQIAGVVEGRLSLFEIEDVLSSCLLCRACLPSCFSGVTTDEMVRAGREAMVEAKGPDFLKRFVFNSILPYPKWIAAYLKIAFFMKKIGLVRLAEKLRIVPKSLRIADLLMGDAPNRFLRERLKGRQAGARTGEKVAYFLGCGSDYLLPEAGEAAIKAIERLGYCVVIPENNCCGLPPYAYGYTPEAKELARKNIKALEGFETILTECGSCSSFLKKYADLLADDPEYAEKAKSISKRVMDSSEFIFKNLPLTLHESQFAVQGLKVTYHDPCHLSRYQGITKEPREIIKSIPGVEFVELPEADWCCGGAGTYSIANNDISLKILDRKIGNVKKTGADILATSCPACMVQLSYGVKRARLKIEVIHVNQLLAQALN